MRKQASHWQTTLAAVVIWGGLCTVNVLAEQGPDTSSRTSGRSVSEFLTLDGRFDLEAARLSGFEGSLDLDDANLQFDPRTGEQRVRPSAALTPTDDPDDIYWSENLFCASGLGTCYALTVYQGRLIAGGYFTVAGCASVNNIAAWDGASWSPLGEGLDHDVTSLAVYGDLLVASGFSTTVGGLSMNYIVAWNGSKWSSLGSGLVNGSIYAMQAFDGKLYVGGSFSMIGEVAANNIASYDGVSWSSVASGVNGAVRALTVYNNKLIAGGSFAVAGEVTAAHIALWDGSNWSSAGSGVSNDVTAFALLEDRLVVAGSFTMAGGVGTSGIAFWDGSSWYPLICYDSPVHASALVVYDGRLIIFDSQLGGIVYGNDGGNFGWYWGILGSGSVKAFGVYDGNLIAGGEYVVWTMPDYGHADGVASWNGITWSRMPAGTEGTIRAFASLDSSLIAAGSLRTVAGIDVNGIVTWDETSWQPLCPPSNDIMDIEALAVYDGQLIATGGVPVSGKIAAWDGVSSWTSLGGGMQSNTYEGCSIRALAVYAGKLFAGGVFRRAGGISAENIAVWDGTQWSPVGSGVNGLVFALTIFDNKLIAAGAFTKAGELDARRIASWDGSTWEALGPLGAQGSVMALAVYDDKLMAGGQFRYIGCVFANNIAQWDGTSWMPMGQGVNDYVRALTSYDGHLIVGGAFDSAGSSVVNFIAAWDGADWSPLGSGLDGFVTTLGVSKNSLLVSGWFRHAGGRVSVGIAQWTKDSPTDVDQGEQVNLPDAFSLVQNYPNPFNPATTIEYNVPSRTQVTIEIFNVLGQKVRTLVNETKSAGSYRTEWDGIDDTGKPVSTGVYLYRFSAGDVVQTKKMMLLK